MLEGDEKSNSHFVLMQMLLFFLEMLPQKECTWKPSGRAQLELMAGTEKSFYAYFPLRNQNNPHTNSYQYGLWIKTWRITEWRCVIVFSSFIRPLFIQETIIDNLLSTRHSTLPWICSCVRPGLLLCMLFRELHSSGIFTSTTFALCCFFPLDGHSL